MGAPQQQATSAVLAPLDPAPAPSGLLQYCVRTTACGAAALEPGVVNGAIMDVSERWPARAALPGALAAATSEASDRAHVAGRLFSAMLLAATPPPDARARDARVRLTRKSWRELARVNGAINRAITPMSDAAQFGVDEFWSTPLAAASAAHRRARGDCEDYALEKRARLLALGWRADALSLAVARAPGGELHTVLLAHTDHGDFVLDNLNRAPRALAELDYDWLWRQSGADLVQWARAGVEQR